MRRKDAFTAVGKVSGLFTRTIYGALVVDADHRQVINASVLRGWKLIASLKPHEELIGMSVYEVQGSSPPDYVTKRKKMWESFLQGGQLH